MPIQTVQPRHLHTVPRTWNRGLNSLTPEVPPEPRMPEPVQLYSLIVLTFHVHGPDEHSDALPTVCEMCHEPWPCPQVRLAFRLREGF